MLFRSVGYPNAIIMSNGYLFPSIFVVALVAFGFKFRMEKRQGMPSADTLRWQLIMLSWFILQVGIILPWKSVEDRYFLPAMVGCTIFLGSEIGKWIERMGQPDPRPSMIRKFLPGFISWVSVLLMVEQGSQIWNYANAYLIGERMNERMVRYLAYSAPRASTIYMNLVGAPIRTSNEWLYETQVHLHLFYNRKDLRTNYLILSKDSSYTSKDLIGVWYGNQVYSQKEINAFFRDRILLSYVVRNYSRRIDLSLRNIAENIWNFLSGPQQYQQTMYSIKLHQWEIYSIVR